MKAYAIAMIEPFVTRLLQTEDHRQWLQLWDSYNAFYGRIGPTSLDPEITSTTWSRFFDAYEPLHALVVEDNGDLLGFTHYLLHRSTTSVAPSIYLQDLFTREDSRGRGIARALIEAVYEAARRTGVRRVYWQTHESNETAMRLYDQVAERSGFIVYRRII